MKNITISNPFTDNLLNFFKELSGDDKRVFIIKLKSVYSYREQEALYNRGLYLQGGKNIINK